jgi:hypothetical protein
MSGLCPERPSDWLESSVSLFSKGDVMERNMRRSELFSLRTRTAGILVARGGKFWLTRRGDCEDYLLDTGDRFMLPEGEWLVQALAGGLLEWTTAVSVPVRLTHETRRFSPVSGF